ncbi:hypothetical protein H0H81_005944 [Sphagnurus paluster]|uniref:Eisosome component PIL1-domain-containing protein n=1 Tax=Sphagnurus paluster TaxID=117069 RepID=A0A9P7K4Y0_9AGAR|nr:hypothetical protein H0H81_005944 [Sphagnurus paluster]
MFKSAATKIAHNSTIPALGGNHDLRPLQDLILAEKQVLISLQRLSVDFAKSAEALKIWGSGEGDDLGDILGASTTLMTQWSNALTQYASYGHQMRDSLKAIRTREEKLDELKRRRKAVCAKAESAEKKLSKMSPEHKNLLMQTEALNALRAEIRTMDSDIMTEEAAIGDFKRTMTKSWMGLKFGGLVECAEKGRIAGEYGRLIVAVGWPLHYTGANLIVISQEIPEEQTQPGMPRNTYYGRAKTEILLSEAYRSVNEVGMSTGPKPPSQLHGQDQAIPSSQGQPQNPFGTPQPPFHGLPHQQTGNSETFGGTPNYLPAPQGLGTGEFFNQPGSPAVGPGSPTQQQYPQPGQLGGYHGYPELQAPPAQHPRSVDDFGVGTQSSGLADQPGPANGGRFATFPVKRSAAGGTTYTVSDPLHHETDSFSSSVAQALSSTSAQGAPSSFYNPEVSYEVSHTVSYTPPPGPPPGAAVQAPVTSGDRNAQHEDNGPANYADDAILAYMLNPAPEDPHDDTVSRHVRFGGVDDMEEEYERRQNIKNDEYEPSYQTQPEKETLKEKGQEELYSPLPEGQPPQYQDLSPRADTAPTRPSLEIPSGKNGGGSANSSPTAVTGDTRFQNQRRIPPPSLEPEEDERALNAAAAREISRELDALSSNFTPPVSPNPSRPSLSEVPDRARTGSLTSLGYPAYNLSAIDNSPLTPPVAPYSRRTPSPHPGTDSPYSPPTAYNRSSPYPPEAVTSEYRQQQPSPPLPDATARMSLSNSRFSNSSAPSRNYDDLPRLPTLSTPLGSPYQTPPEYPSSRGPGVPSSPVSKSSTSLNSQIPPGTRTISAAAFKRSPARMVSGEVPALADNGGTNPLNTIKKRLPASPHPQRDASPSSRGRSGSATALAPATALPPLPAMETSDDDYDYLSAYVASGERDQNEPPEVTPGQGGYAEGRFATDLEGGGGLR